MVKRYQSRERDFLLESDFLFSNKKSDSTASGCEMRRRRLFYWSHSSKKTPSTHLTALITANQYLTWNLGWLPFNNLKNRDPLSPWGLYNDLVFITCNGDPNLSKWGPNFEWNGDPKHAYIHRFWVWHHLVHSIQTGMESIKASFCYHK